MSDPDKRLSPVVKTRSQTKVVPPASRRRRRGRLRTLARLSLGGMLLAMDTLTDHLQQWEEKTAQPPSDRPPTESVLKPMHEWETVLNNTSRKSGRYALIGFISESQAHLKQRGEILQRVEQTAEKVIDFVAKPLRASQVLTPVRSGFQTLLERGEAQVAHWVKLGRVEEERSRALAQTALHQLIDESMDELAENPRVQIFIQEVVQTQSLGLADEVVEEIRERTVTADLILERLVRLRFGHPPRESLPAPEVHYFQVRPTPTERARTTEQAYQGHYAGFVARLLAFVIDVGVLSISLGLIVWFVAALNGLFRLESFFGNLVGLSTFHNVMTAIVSLAGTLFVIGYPLFFWVLTGQTPGKMLMGLRVITLDGHHVSLWRAVRRLIGLVLAALPLFIGLLWILIDARWQGLHDKLAGTCVIYSWPACPDETFLRDHLQ
jgi:uncharacterized RDD family membrane protein YckC